ncbi:MAG: transposase [Victivallaceae bacterium]|nr:transposase [Victivallaceae bacterium]
MEDAAKSFFVSAKSAMHGLLVGWLQVKRSASVYGKIYCSIIYDDMLTFRWHRGFKKSGKQGIGRSHGGLTTKIHMVTASDRAAVSFSLSAGNIGDGPEGRKLLIFYSRKCRAHKFVLMDRAYEGDATRNTAVELGYIPIVPPKRNRKEPWEYDQILYKRRNEVERFFLRTKRFGRYLRVMTSWISFFLHGLYCLQ